MGVHIQKKKIIGCYSWNETSEEWDINFFLSVASNLNLAQLTNKIDALNKLTHKREKEKRKKK